VSDTLADNAWEANHALAELPGTQQLCKPGVTQAVGAEPALLKAWPTGKASALPAYSLPAGKAPKVRG
jgi:hypothetical protein